MFDIGGSFLTQSISLLDHMTTASVAENKAAHAKITAAGHFWSDWIERDAELATGTIIDCGNNALAEMAVRLGVSKTTAETFAGVGMDLRLRLPRVNAAFAAGELDYPRVARICRATTGFTHDTLDKAEEEILADALHMSPGPLARAIDKTLIRTSPDEYATLRKEQQQFRRVRRRRGDALSVIEAHVNPDEAEAVLQRLTEIADTVCTHDTRGRDYRMADAFMALMHGETHLDCSCGRDDCAVAGQPRSDKRRTPLVQVTVDIATLLGLLSNPAYLDGHGPIDPDLARTLADDGTWQVMLTECLHLAEEHGLIEREPTTQFVARGGRHNAGIIPEPAAVQPDPVVPAATPPPAVQRHIPVHVGRVQGPTSLRLPKTAFIYRPNAETTALVRARDQHCRFPGCNVPAAKCQLDHIEEFDQTNPPDGGLTLPENLQCLCQLHHTLKTLKLWRAEALPGSRIRWTSSHGEHFITTPGGRTTAVPPAHLKPKLTITRNPELPAPPTTQPEEPAPF
ncbi:HNH endonuclease signature motif containing protein [Antrihabitans stalactiti]|uniref:DUF222 domain-containing protein n=1 Tax=Antrihabitans stalactiti TaxID=2584121 RepID=A0A848KPN0_9NOCA|nr:HNH endonuclease signature motif containing protein [Antrihabitans stalactiti]NMN98250.1 DUF222 domain-containing protein [Antrihabitans stalactiti]